MHPKPLLDFEQIKQIIKQRYPFLMVDKVLKLNKNHSIVTQKNVTGNEPYFKGYFPQKAVMPGAFIMEGMAQSSILLFYLSNGDSGQSENNLFLFVGANGKFIHPVYPGDVLIMEVENVKTISSAAIVKSIATVDNTVVTEAQLTFSLARSP